MTKKSEEEEALREVMELVERNLSSTDRFRSSLDTPYKGIDQDAFRKFVDEHMKPIKPSPSKALHASFELTRPGEKEGTLFGFSYAQDVSSREVEEYVLRSFGHGDGKHCLAPEFDLNDLKERYKIVRWSLF